LIHSLSEPLLVIMTRTEAKVVSAAMASHTSTSPLRLCPCLSWSSYHRIPSIFTCLLSISAYTLAWIATASCEFVDVEYTHRQVADNKQDQNQNGRSYIPDILDVPSYYSDIIEDRTSSQFAQSHSVGIFCPFTDSSNNGEEGGAGALWTVSQSFTIITLVFTTLSVVLTILISTIVPPNDLNWRVVGYLSTCILLVSVPVFWMLDSDALPCHIGDGNSAVQCLLGDNAIQWIVQMCLHVVIASITITLQPPNQWAAESDVWKRRRTTRTGTSTNSRRNHAGMPLHERLDIAGHIYNYDEERLEEEDVEHGGDHHHEEIANNRFTRSNTSSNSTCGQRVTHFFVELLDLAYLQETSFFFLARNRNNKPHRHHMNRMSEEDASFDDDVGLDLGLALMEDDYDIEPLEESGAFSELEQREREQSLLVSTDGTGGFTQAGGAGSTSITAAPAQFDPKLSMMVVLGGNNLHCADDDDSMELSIGSATAFEKNDGQYRPNRNRSNKSMKKDCRINRNRSVPPSLLSRNRNKNTDAWKTNVNDDDGEEEEEETEENIFDEVNAQFFTSANTTNNNDNGQLLGNDRSCHTNERRSNKKQRRQRRKDKENNLESEPLEEDLYQYEPPPSFNIDLDDLVVATTEDPHSVTHSSLSNQQEAVAIASYSKQPKHKSGSGGAIINIKSLDICTALLLDKDKGNADADNDANINLDVDDDEGSAKAQQIIESLLSLPGEDNQDDVDDVDTSTIISLDKDELSVALSRVSSMAEDSDDDEGGGGENQMMHNHFSLSSNRFNMSVDDTTDDDTAASESMHMRDLVNENDDVNGINTSLASTSPFRSSSNRILMMADTSMDDSIDSVDASLSPVLKLLKSPFDVDGGQTTQKQQEETVQDKKIAHDEADIDSIERIDDKTITTESVVISEEIMVAEKTAANESDRTCNSNNQVQVIIPEHKPPLVAVSRSPANTDTDICSGNNAPAAQASVLDHVQSVPVVVVAVDDVDCTGTADEVIVVDPVIMSRASSSSSSSSSVPEKTPTDVVVASDYGVPVPGTDSRNNTTIQQKKDNPIPEINVNVAVVSPSIVPVSPASKHSTSSTFSPFNSAETCPFDERTRIRKEDCGSEESETTPFDEEIEITSAEMEMMEVKEKENNINMISNANVSMVLTSEPSSAGDNDIKSNSPAVTSSGVPTATALDSTAEKHDDADAIVVNVAPAIVSPEKEPSSALWLSAETSPKTTTCTVPTTAKEKLPIAVPPSSTVTVISPLRRLMPHTAPTPISTSISTTSMMIQMPPVPVTPDAKTNNTRAMTPTPSRSSSRLPPRPPSLPGSADRALLKGGRYYGGKGKQLWENRHHGSNQHPQTPSSSSGAAMITTDAGPDRVLSDDEFEV
jgi:hypothetical protein